MTASNMGNVPEKHNTKEERKVRIDYQLIMSLKTEYGSHIRGLK